ncbi:MAG: hypothetical protein PVI75_05770 [Gammaproteobacteria bacterium]|jgi:hypothetical protein
MYKIQRKANLFIDFNLASIDFTYNLLSEDNTKYPVKKIHIQYMCGFSKRFYISVTCESANNAKDILENKTIIAIKNLQGKNPEYAKDCVFYSEIDPNKVSGEDFELLIETIGKYAKVNFFKKNEIKCLIKNGPMILKNFIDFINNLGDLTVTNLNLNRLKESWNMLHKGEFFCDFAKFINWDKTIFKGVIKSYVHRQDDKLNQLLHFKLVKNKIQDSSLFWILTKLSTMQKNKFIVSHKPNFCFKRYIELQHRLCFMYIKNSFIINYSYEIFDKNLSSTKNDLSFHKDKSLSSLSKYNYVRISNINEKCYIFFANLNNKNGELYKVSNSILKNQNSIFYNIFKQLLFKYAILSISYAKLTTKFLDNISSAIKSKEKMIDVFVLDLPPDYNLCSKDLKRLKTIIINSRNFILETRLISHPNSRPKQMFNSIFELFTGNYRLPSYIDLSKHNMESKMVNKFQKAINEKVLLVKVDCKERGAGFKTLKYGLKQGLFYRKEFIDTLIITDKKVNLSQNSF